MSETPDFRVYSLDEFSEKVDADFRARRRFYDNNVIADTVWDGWRLDPDRLALELFDTNQRSTYEVDLKQCLDSAQILDWLVQLSSKVWGEHDMAKVTTGLLRAFDDILHLQANVCSEGAHRVLTSQRTRELVSVFLQRFHTGEQP
ncbi:hypothetical protein [Streptosporangium sp. NPDC051022]|uniref:hypothetical protein n=1 Tax=Streptosporangium sp. NPDC051022 TaxID=3155752 RepID=UPI00343343E6